MLTKQLAEEIVEQTMIRLNRNLNVMDTNGMILASGDVDRIEWIHEGAAHVAKTGEVLWITNENLVDWRGSKPGVNLPIYFKEKLVGIIGITGNPEELKEISTLVQLTTEMMVHQSFITSHTEWSRKLNELIFEELISGKPLSLVVNERLDLLKLTQKSTYVTLLIEFERMPPPSHRILEQLEDHFNPSSVLTGHSQLNEIFVLLAGIDSTRLETTLSKLLHFLQKVSTVRIGVGISVSTIDEIRNSYTTAKNALQFGKPGHQLIYFEDVELIALLKRNPKSAVDHFTNRTLEGLNKQLRLTLTAYFDCNTIAAETTSLLNIHRHTLSYRLKKVEDITGLNPTLFRDAIILHTALLLSD
ncbi:sugar diacid recognition domain-containing protein [Paenisporosarcina sp. TG20]|uniref:CdaR family transcriptional regulator n=1 Tax=Paenisporosarcina sp. TG20 TaxID=1211706 RepID=UPI0003118651|nr:sugar diacid recognition domain-containing protein [Paenisporosarcina sp. TG20]